MTDTIPFDDWIKRVFDRAAIDEDSWWREETQWNDLPSSVSLDYFSRLFEESSQLLRSYSDAQINQGLWFLLGPKHDNNSALLAPNILWPIRLRFIRSILRLFEMFANRCSPHLSHEDDSGASPLNSICYMFWHKGRSEWQSDDPNFAETDRALLSVMKEVLQSPSEACQESALHGLGHWQRKHPKEVEQVVDNFLARNTSISPKLRKYAESARRGNVL